MGILGNLFKGSRTQNRGNVAEIIKHRYNVDISTMSESEKNSLREKIGNSVIGFTRKTVQKFKTNKKLLNDIKGKVTSKYGVDQSLLSEVNGNLISFDSSGLEDFHVTIDVVNARSYKLDSILKEIVINPIIDEINNEFKDLVDSNVISIEYTDEGFLVYIGTF